MDVSSLSLQEPWAGSLSVAAFQGRSSAEGEVFLPSELVSDQLLQELVERHILTAGELELNAPLGISQVFSLKHLFEVFKGPFSLKSAGGRHASSLETGGFIVLLRSLLEEVAHLTGIHSDAFSLEIVGSGVPYILGPSYFQNFLHHLSIDLPLEEAAPLFAASLKELPQDFDIRILLPQQVRGKLPEQFNSLGERLARRAEQFIDPSGKLSHAMPFRIDIQSGQNEQGLEEHYLLLQLEGEFEIAGNRKGICFDLVFPSSLIYEKLFCRDGLYLALSLDFSSIAVAFHREADSYQPAQGVFDLIFSQIRWQRDDLNVAAFGRALHLMLRGHRVHGPRGRALPKNFIRQAASLSHTPELGVVFSLIGFYQRKNPEEFFAKILLGLHVLRAFGMDGCFVNLEQVRDGLLKRLSNEQLLLSQQNPIGALFIDQRFSLILIESALTLLALLSYQRGAEGTWLTCHFGKPALSFPLSFISSKRTFFLFASAEEALLIFFKELDALAPALQGAFFDQFSPLYRAALFRGKGVERSLPLPWQIQPLSEPLCSLICHEHSLACHLGYSLLTALKRSGSPLGFERIYLSQWPKALLYEQSQPSSFADNFIDWLEGATFGREPLARLHSLWPKAPSDWIAYLASSDREELISYAFQSWIGLSGIEKYTLSFCLFEAFKQKRPERAIKVLAAMSERWPVAQVGKGLFSLWHHALLRDELHSLWHEAWCQKNEREALVWALSLAKGERMQLSREWPLLKPLFQKIGGAAFFQLDPSFFSAWPTIFKGQHPIWQEKGLRIGYIAWSGARREGADQALSLLLEDEAESGSGPGSRSGPRLSRLLLQQVSALPLDASALLDSALKRRNQPGKKEQLDLLIAYFYSSEVVNRQLNADERGLFVEHALLQKTLHFLLKKRQNLPFCLNALKGAKMDPALWQKFFSQLSAMQDAPLLLQAVDSLVDLSKELPARTIEQLLPCWQRLLTLKRPPDSFLLFLIGKGALFQALCRSKWTAREKVLYLEPFFQKAALYAALKPAWLSSCVLHRYQEVWPVLESLPRQPEESSFELSLFSSCLKRAIAPPISFALALLNRHLERQRSLKGMNQEVYALFERIDPGALSFEDIQLVERLLLAISEEKRLEPLSLIPLIPKISQIEISFETLDLFLMKNSCPLTDSNSAKRLAIWNDFLGQISPESDAQFFVAGQSLYHSIQAGSLSPVHLKRHFKSRSARLLLTRSLFFLAKEKKQLELKISHFFLLFESIQGCLQEKKDWHLVQGALFLFFKSMNVYKFHLEAAHFLQHLFRSLPNIQIPFLDYLLPKIQEKGPFFYQGMAKPWCAPLFDYLTDSVGEEERLIEFTAALFSRSAFLLEESGEGAYYLKRLEQRFQLQKKNPLAFLRLSMLAGRPILKKEASPMLLVASASLAIEDLVKSMRGNLVWNQFLMDRVQSILILCCQSFEGRALKLGLFLEPLKSCFSALEAHRDAETIGQPFQSLLLFWPELLDLSLPPLFLEQATRELCHSLSHFLNKEAIQQRVELNQLLLDLYLSALEKAIAQKLFTEATHTLSNLFRKWEEHIISYIVKNPLSRYFSHQISVSYMQDLFASYPFLKEGDRKAFWLRMHQSLVRILSKEYEQLSSLDLDSGSPLLPSMRHLQSAMQELGLNKGEEKKE
ncbi:MAG: hypothetical protein K0S07_1598 [Chlamydiales bacterium]|jgi:hypothetical protein|nr:hypothetical protein [Chlamydiales bacterium]